MTSIIEQADAIVGIDTKSNRAVCGLPPRMIEFVRRGAYVEWFIHDPARSIHEMRVPSIAHNTLEDLAREIVRLHKPKGDGLPDIEFHARNDMCGFVDVVACAKVPCSIDETGRLLKRLNEFNSPPVRRLLAAFEVVDEQPKVMAYSVPKYEIRSGSPSWNLSEPIFWLAPRGER